MRRVRNSYHSARTGGVVFSSALLIALLAALLPTVASADDTPAPTDPPVAEETDAPEFVVPDNSIKGDADPETEEPGDATPEEAGPDDAEVDETTAAIPTPEDGDYVGSNTPDDADPGAYSQAEGDQLHAMGTQGFRAGNIISDAKLYTSGTMTAKQMQYFFDQKVPNCDPNYTCLKDFSMSTRTKAPTAYCSGTYQGSSNDTAAQIISKVSKACNVSEKALVVMLQKEQGLVTHTWPSDFRYDIAMGYACPDDAPCDEQYFGFQNQMYMAASQLQRYTKDDYFSWYPVGQTSPVRWHPNPACGSGDVYIENNATAALYYYTPYQPNKAALAAGYGIGDACSAYGNRNFYNYYTDWFGPTHGGDKAPKPSPEGKDAIAAKWRALGGASGVLGKATGSATCDLKNDGCVRSFQKGKIAWTKSTGAHYVTGSHLSRWTSMSSQNGRLGYPTSDPRCVLENDGCGQRFEKGRIHSTKATGAHATTNSILDTWRSSGWQTGELGYPTEERWCDGAMTVCTQQFEFGKVHWLKGTGTFMTTSSIHEAWVRSGSGGGTLGQPISDRRCDLDRGGCSQKFEHGRIHWTKKTGAHATYGVFMEKWREFGWQTGELGYPTADKRCGLEYGGCAQRFEGGRIHWSPDTGTHRTVGEIMREWRSQGWQAGRLGYPIGDGNCSAAGDRCVQWFEGGSVRWERGEGTSTRYWFRAL